MIGTVGGTALGTYILGLGFDLTGGYDAALYFLLTLPILATVASFIIKRPPVKSAQIKEPHTLTSFTQPSPVELDGKGSIDPADQTADQETEQKVD
jgi:hypothetical protein